jgi:magnesium chelatase subunit H
LPALLAESRGRTIEEIYRGNDNGVLADVELNRTITETCRAAVGAMVRQVTGADGRVSLRQNFGWFFALLERFRHPVPQPLALGLQIGRLCLGGSGRTGQALHLPELLPATDLR